MSNVPRGRTNDEGRRLADATPWPVLARLPEASAEGLVERLAKPGESGRIEYRFDPPQTREAGTQTPSSVQGTISQQPHMLDRGRSTSTRGIPRRESPVLPRSNPFSNPRPRLVDSVAPAVRFLTMAVLFTAAGLWFQMLGRDSAAPTRSIEPPKTAAQPAVAPAKSVDHHTVPLPTATGPIESQPESGARVGRVDGDDFASRDSAAGPAPAVRPTATPPHFLISAGSQVPRVRVSDSDPTAVDGTAQGAAENPDQAPGGDATGNTESSESPAVARYPGFLMDIPTR
jgi:hypothetical protein